MIFQALQIPSYNASYLSVKLSQKLGNYIIFLGAYYHLISIKHFQLKS